MPYGITQGYLPPGSGDFYAFTPAGAGTWFKNPGGMLGWVDLAITYVRDNRAVSWLGIEPTTESSVTWCISCVLTHAFVQFAFTLFFYNMCLSHLNKIYLDLTYVRDMST